MIKRAYSSGVPGIIAMAICVTMVAACGTSAQTARYTDGIYYIKPADVTVVNIREAQENSKLLSEVTSAELLDARNAEEVPAAGSTKTANLKTGLDLSGSSAILCYDPQKGDVNFDPFWNTVVISDNSWPSYNWRYYNSWNYYGPWGYYDWRYRFDPWFYGVSWHYDPWYWWHDPWRYDPWYHFSYYDPWYHDYYWHHHAYYDPWYHRPTPPLHHDPWNNRPRPDSRPKFYAGGAGHGMASVSNTSIARRNSSVSRTSATKASGMSS